MANVASVLSILVNADTGAATAKLAKFDRTVQSSQRTARKGIEARLGGNFNQKAFSEYEKSLSRIQRRIRDKNAFKAELGGSYSPAAFNAYQRSLDKAEKGQSSLKHNQTDLEKSTGSLGGSFGRLALAVGGAVSAYVGFSAMKNAVQYTLDLAGATQQLTAVTGMDAKTASEWIEVFKVRGVQTKMVTMGFITLEKQMKAARDGSAKAADAFKELGVSQDVLARGDVNAVLLQTADAFQKMKDPTERAALAQQLFGRNAKSLIPILAQGRKGVEDALGAAERYGAFLPKNVKQLKEARKAQFEWNFAMDGLKIAFTQAVLPALMDGVHWLLEFIAQLRSGKGVGGAFTDVLRIIKDVVGGVVGGIKGFIDEVKRGNPIFVAAAGGLKGIASALVIMAGIGIAKSIVAGLAGIAAVLGPWGLFATAVAAVVGGVVELYNKVPAVHKVLQPFAHDINWLKDRALELADALGLIPKKAPTKLPPLQARQRGEPLAAPPPPTWTQDTIKAVEGAMAAVKKAIDDAIQWIETAWKNVTKFLEPVTKPIIDGFNKLIPAVQSVINALIPILAPLFQIFKAMFTPLIAAVQALLPAVQPVLQVLGAVFGAALAMITVMLKAFAGILQGVAWVVSNILAPVFTTVFTAMAAIVKVAVGAMVWAFNSVLKPVFVAIAGFIQDVLAPAFTGGFNLIKGAVVGAVNWIVGVVQKIGAAFAALPAQISACWTLIKTAVGAIANGILAIIKGIQNALFAAGKAIFTAFRNGIVAVAQAIGGTVKTIASAVVTDVKAVGGAMFNAGKFILNKVVDGLKAAWGGLKAITGAIIHSVVSVLTGTFNAFYNAGKFLFNAIVSGFKAIWNTLKNIAHSIIDSVVNVINSFFNAAYNAGKFIINAVGKGFAAAFKAVINTIVDFLNLIIGVIDKIPGVHVGKIGHMAQGGSIDRGGVQALANGGKVTKPMAIVGEEAPRHPEYVIPTNPAYRSRAMGLWQETGSKLGVPGFARGGYLVKASAEDDVGKTGYRGNIIQSRGYSELSIPPSSLNFSALGNLPYGYPLTVATQAGRAVRVAKQDVGAGSSFNPVMGLYPQTVADLGLSGGEFTVAITDDSRLRPMSTVGAASLAAGGSFLSAIGSAFEAAFGTITDAAGAVASVIAKLPKAVHLPDWINGLPPYVLEKVGGWIKDKVTSIFPSFLAPVTSVSSAGAAGTDGLHDAIRDVMNTVLRQFPGLSVSSTTSGTHAEHSYHYQGRAVDIIGDSGTMYSASGWIMSSGLYRRLLEGIHNPNLSVKYGAAVEPYSTWGADTWGQHANHIHLAAARGGILSNRGLITAFADGGTMTQTGMALVGEKGPELVTLPAGATVTPTNAVAGWGGEPYTHWNLPGSNVTDYAPWIQVLRSMIRLPADPTAANNAYRSRRMGVIGDQMKRVRWIGTSTSGGEVNRLTELMRVTQEMWDFMDYPSHGSLTDYLSFQLDAKGNNVLDAKGEPIIDIDKSGLATRRSHLKQTYDWYVKIRDYLQESWNRLKVGIPGPPGVISRIQSVIRERQEEIQQIQQRIKDNIRIIDRANDLVKKIKAHIAQNQQLIGQNQAQWHQLGTRLDHPPREWMPKEKDQKKRKASWNALITQNMIKLQRTIGALQGPIPGWKANVSALQNLVKPIQNANVMLGGAPNKVGGGGRLKGFNDQVTSLQGMLDEANQTANTVGGQWGWGGELSTAKLDVLKAARSMGEWDDVALQKAMTEFKKGYVAPVGEGAGTEGAGVSGADQEALNAAQKLADLYKQQLVDSRQAFAVSQAQYAVLQKWPFAGAYAMGGTVSKRGWSLVGEQGPELAQLPIGTHVLNANQTANMTEQPGPVQVQVVILDGAVDPSKIKVIAEGAAVNVIRGETRRGRRGLAGGGGG